MLKANTYGEILVGLQKMLKIINAVPQMEAFIKEVCSILLPKEDGVLHIDVCETINSFEDCAANIANVETRIERADEFKRRRLQHPVCS